MHDVIYYDAIYYGMTSLHIICIYSDVIVNMLQEMDVLKSVSLKVVNRCLKDPENFFP